MNRRRAPKTTDSPPKPGPITAIEPQRRDDARVNIFIAESFAFGLHTDIVLNRRLAIGTQLTDADIATLLAEDEVRKAITAALNLLSYRPRASGELQRSLRSKGYSADAADKAVWRMAELGYLNDGDFAQRWVENRQEHRPRSKRLLTQELRQRGIDADIIEDALANIVVDEYADALSLATTKSASMQALDTATRHRRLGGFLARRGYGYDIIRRVLEEIG